MDVLVTSNAAQDLEDILNYIEEHESLERADALYEKLKAAILSLGAMPNRGRIVPELREIGVRGEYREVLMKPYRLLYFTEAKRVFVFAVFDGRRSLDELLQRRVLDL